MLKNNFKSNELIKCKESEVKPCPFCGGKEIFVERYETVVGERYRILCAGCIAMIDPGWVQHPNLVKEMWNKRV